MMKFTILVIASVLAPGLHAAIVQTRPADISIGTFPAAIVPETRPLPAEITPETRPLPAEVTPELRPLPLPVAPELRPLPVPEVEAVNPCDACFEYMNDLIGQLTEVAVPEETPDVPEVEINPIPVPVVPELRPLPIPEISLLPLYVD